MIFEGEEIKKILRELLGRNKPRRETEMVVAKPALVVFAFVETQSSCAT
jgi:hypothetical protein